MQPLITKHLQEREEKNNNNNIINFWYNSMDIKSYYSILRNKKANKLNNHKLFTYLERNEITGQCAAQNWRDTQTNAIVTC